jgi:hypothetical protein
METCAAREENEYKSPRDWEEDAQLFNFLLSGGAAGI